MKEYLLCFAQQNVHFRIADIESIAKLFKIKISFRKAIDRFELAEVCCSFHFFSLAFHSFMIIYFHSLRLFVLLSLMRKASKRLLHVLCF